MIRLSIALLGLLVLVGCGGGAPESSPDEFDLKIDSEPQGAEVFLRIGDSQDDEGHVVGTYKVVGSTPLEMTVDKRDRGPYWEIKVLADGYEEYEREIDPSLGAIDLKAKLKKSE
jgi:hypothetical protein